MACAASANCRAALRPMLRRLGVPSGSLGLACRHWAHRPDTDCFDIDLVVPHLAIGYSRERTGEGQQWRSNTFEHVIRGGPAGGGYATAPDLLAFAEALRSGKLVEPSTLDRLWSPKPALASNEYGFGFGLRQGPGGRSVGHSGGFPGISSNLDIWPESGYVAVVLSNLDGGSEAIVEKIRELLGRMR